MMTSWISARSRSSRTAGSSFVDTVPPSPVLGALSSICAAQCAQIGDSAASALEGPHPVGHLHHIEPGVAVRIMDLAALGHERRGRHGVAAAREARRRRRLVEVGDLLGVGGIADVEHPQAREDEAARRDAGVDLAGYGAVMAGVALQAAIGAGVVLL